MILITTGGRYYSDSIKVNSVLSALNPNFIHVGDAKGADSLVVEWCKANNIMHIKYEADWKKYGNAAGPIRNEMMLQLAGTEALVLAFPGGKGTNNCVSQAKKFGHVVLRVE